ncbi:MAG: tyrosine-type recombinase/integrase [Saprospirales bacterium]|nr:tyrosine-type recombinase/integrase [Saprospirales bacterium]MBK8489310.1 tyrosine-type recombinase/integrase [Saprospirales bacterium]
MEEYQKQLQEFDAHLTLKNYSKATRSAYGCALRQFFTFRDREDMSGPFTTTQAREYILHRYKQGLKWQTINGDYSAMSKFYREVLGLDWDVRLIPRPRKERSLPPVLSGAEVQRVIENGAIFKHQVFMALLYSTGLRLSEALNLRLSDVDGERLQIRVVKGKGAKDRYVEMPECLLDLLRQYFRAYRPKHYLFNGKKAGQRWAQRSAQWSIQNARAGAKVEREVSPHVFRHCYACTWWAAHCLQGVWPGSLSVFFVWQ